MRKILVPTDFTEHANYATEVAAQLARKIGGEILLLHMLELPSTLTDKVTPGYDIPEIMFFKNHANNKLEEASNNPVLDDLSVSIVMKLGKASDGILSVAKAENVDFIVMGSHGASGFQEMIVGSNAEKVVRNSEVPVLVIKGEHKYFTANQMIFASDFSDEIKKPFAKLLEMVNVLGSHLHLVMINTPNTFKPTLLAEEIMDKFLANFDLPAGYTRTIFNDVNVEKGILNYANKIDADIIAMSTHGRTGINHFFVGSISEDLVNHAPRPVLTFRIN